MKKVGLLFLNILISLALFFFVAPHQQPVFAVCATGSSCVTYAGSCANIGQCAGLGTCSGGICCKTCTATSTPTPVCAEGATRCNGLVVQECVANKWVNVETCSCSCSNGTCGSGPYCKSSCTLGCSSNSCSGGTCITPTPTPTPVACGGTGTSLSCSVKTCGTGYTCGAYFGYCQCMPGATPTPKPCGGAGDSATCAVQTCTSGTCTSLYSNCYCITPTPTKAPTNTPTQTPTPTPTSIPKYVCNKVTGVCAQSVSGTMTFLQCDSSCVKNTPTPTPATCHSVGVYSCSGSCSNGGTCSTDGTSYGCVCTTNTTPTPTTAPLPTGEISGSCVGYPKDQLACSGGDSLYKCTWYTPTNKVWQFYENCNFNCYSGTTMLTNTCDTRTSPPQCCPDNSIEYCFNFCDDPATTRDENGVCLANQQQLYCWDNYVTSLKGVFYAKDGYPKCVSSTGYADPCGCVQQWSICGGTALLSTCQALDPSWVPRTNNCSDNYCGPACVVPPTPTGGYACVRDCSCASTLFFGETCPDGCGGTCYGILTGSGTITAKALLLGVGTSCADLESATQTADGTRITIDGIEQIQNTGQTITWSNVPTSGNTLYTPSVVPPNQSIRSTTCVSTNGGAYIQSPSGYLSNAGTLSFLIGIAPQAGWVQTKSGDVYAANSVVSSIPDGAIDPFFVLNDNTIGADGIVTYGSTYDFSLSTADLGESKLSSKGWLTSQQYAPTDWYARFVSQLDIPGSATSLANPSDQVKPSCGTSPCIYYTEGGLTTQAGTPWNILAGEKIIIFAGGNVTIQSPINIDPGGFFALIANNNITVAPAVGGVPASTTPTLEGIYIATNAGHTATFASGTGANRLIIKGMVVADTFQLLRDIGAANDTTSAEQFIFNPQLLFTMPDAMKEIPYVWQEVAP